MKSFKKIQPVLLAFLLLMGFPSMGQRFHKNLKGNGDVIRSSKIVPALIN